MNASSTGYQAQGNFNQAVGAGYGAAAAESHP